MATIGLAGAAVGGTAVILNGAAVTVPLLAGTSGIFAPSLAAIGLLKLAAAAIIAKGIGIGFLARGRNNDDSYEESGYGYSDAGYSQGGDSYSSGGGDSYSSGSSGYGRHRRRRHALKAEQPQVHLPSEEALFSLISAMDTYGCGKQLICELETKDPKTLAQDESIMLQLFSNPKLKKKESLTSPKAEYELAAEIGKVTKDQVLCRNRYPNCPYTAEEMMTALRNSQL